MINKIEVAKFKGALPIYIKQAIKFTLIFYYKTYVLRSRIGESVTNVLLFVIFCALIEEELLVLQHKNINYIDYKLTFKYLILFIMKKITFLAVMLITALSFGQAMTNANFETDNLDLTDEGNTPTGWYSENANASITGGQARLTYNDTSGSHIRQDITFTNAGTYKLTYDVSSSSADALVKHSYTGFKAPTFSTFLEVWVPNSNLPSGDTNFGIHKHLGEGNRSNL